MIIKYLAGPLIGAVIGYCTNYIAVKMLFYPRKEVYLFGHQLPFTPGAIPKGKGRLAKAVGQVVSSTLITREDIERRLLSEENGGKIVDSVMEKLSGSIKEQLMEVLSLSEEAYSEKRTRLAGIVSHTVVNSVLELDLSVLLVEKGGSLIKEKVKGTMFKMFLSDDLIQSILGPLGMEIQEKIAEQGVEYVEPFVEEKLIKSETQSAGEVLAAWDISEEKVKEKVTLAYEKAVHEGTKKLLDSIDIAGIIENKINDMSIEELEKMVLEVMKKELDMIVNLGALIGFILGLLNLVL